MYTKVFFAIVIPAIFVMAGGCWAQTATASASATIVTPISLTKTVDMSFGNTAVSALAGGTVTLSPEGTRSTGGSGVTLPATSGVVSAAAFTVTGAPGFTYAITLPESAIMHGPGTADILIDGFASYPSSTGTLDVGGTQTLKVGAMLHVAALQAPGVYTNASAVPVTVNYN